MTLRSAAKRAIGQAALAAPLRARTRASLRGRINVAYLHYVGPRRSYYADFYRGSTLEQFDRTLALLGRHFDFCPLQDALAQPAEATLRPRLAVTFDDGFDLIGTGIADMLELHGVRATTFVITSTIDNRNLMWRNKLSAIRALRDGSRCLQAYNELAKTFSLTTIAEASSLMRASDAWPTDRKEELADALWDLCDMPPLADYLAEERPYFTWSGLAEWLERGHGVGLHTLSHPHCPRLSVEAIEKEIVEAGASLRGRLDLDHLPFSYPFGERFDAETERRLYDAGAFDCAFGIEGFAPRGTPPYRLERAPIESEQAYTVFGRAALGLPR